MDAEEKSSLFSLSIDDITQSHLLSIAKWHKFIAITGVVGFSLAFLAVIVGNIYSYNVLAGVNYSIDMAERAGEIIGSLLVTAIFFIPCIFQLKFANKMIKGLNGNDQFLINQSLRQLKICSRYWGILIIVFIAFVLLSFFIGFINT